MASPKGTFQPDSDVHISYEDQQKINKFARLNAKLEDIKEEIKVKKNDLETLEEASDEITLLPDDEKIPNIVGEVFIYQDYETTEKNLGETMSRIEQDIVGLESKSGEVREAMEDLKSHLYGKFGSHINLEADEE